ncbi:MAG: RNA ligase family protein [Anaerolineae bacterium]|nr:RNA ligase family protein [Gloeobacterales cyanobacterium ES-bin-313]
MELFKYPRTPHIEGSRLQPGDEDLDAVAFDVIAGRSVVIEEKVDGANAGISFSPEGELFLQSRGHFLTGGGREKHFALFKRWAASHSDSLWSILGNRYTLYGEWLYAKHTIFYDALPHYFFEFDLRDRQTGTFLSTPERQALLAGSPVRSVPILFSGKLEKSAQLGQYLGTSRFISPNHRENLRVASESLGLREELTLKQTDPGANMEGIYIKVEEDGKVVERYKYVRASFLAAVDQSGSHWLNRPILPNQLLANVDLFAPKLP